MAKELPYFRFTPSEWQNGKISLEEYEYQGVFINICSYYWINDCSITIAMLEKKFRNDKTLINYLIECNVFYIEKSTGFIVIEFLNEQFDILSEQRKRRQDAGSRGGKMKHINARNLLKQKYSYKDKDKDKDKDNYKSILLSEIDISDFPKINKDHYNIAISFQELFKKNLIDAGANISSVNKAKCTWIDDVRLIIESDHYSIDDIKKVYFLLQKDEFWKQNILSTSKLRKQFDKLILKINGDSKKTSKSETSASDVAHQVKSIIDKRNRGEILTKV